MVSRIYECHRESGMEGRTDETSRRFYENTHVNKCHKSKGTIDGRKCIALIQLCSHPTIHLIHPACSLTPIATTIAKGETNVQCRGACQTSITTHPAQPTEARHRNRVEIIAHSLKAQPKPWREYRVLTLGRRGY